MAFIPDNSFQQRLVDKMETWIYLIKDNFTGLYKIGKSLNPYQRLKNLKRQPTILPIPYDFELVEAWRDEPVRETYLHKYYAKKRKRGEWFALSESDIENIHFGLSCCTKLSTGISDNEAQGN